MSIQLGINVVVSLRGRGDELAEAGARAVRKGCDVEWVETSDELEAMVVRVPEQDDLDATVEAIRYITAP